MIKKILLTLLLTTVGIGIQAKTIKYSQYVTYEGKVDANNLPKGKGKLITSYLVRNFATKSYDKSNDILEGEFDGGNVTNAKLYFESDKKNKLYKSVYKGTLKYSIEKDGLVIVYNLSDGVFTDNVSHDFTITPNASTRIIRYPMTDGTFGKDDGFLPVLRQDVSPSDLIEKYPGMKGIESVGISECYSETDYRLGREWEGIDMGAVYTVKFSEKDYYFNLSTRITGDNVTLRFTNGDVLDSERIRRHFSDGTYIDARNKDGRWDGSLYYAENNSYKGMFRIPELISFSDLIDAKSLNDFSINYTNGTLLKDGAEIKYTNGKSAEELAAEAAAREKEIEEKAAAVVKAREKEEAERAAAAKKEEAARAATAKKEAAQRAQTTKSTNNLDSVLNSYEKFVNQYVAFYKKAMNGDITALAKYPSLLKQAQELDAKLSRAKGELTEAQMARYIKILNKMTSIIQ